MHTETMVHMANQIAIFFSTYPHHEAVAGVAEHLKKFWERRMLEQIYQHVNAGGEGLNPLVIAAVQQLQQVHT